MRQQSPDMREGPCEPTMIQLANGDLMCIMRTGGGAQWHLIRSYSSDRGQTWSPADRLPAFSVDPTVRQVQNGVIALSAGRPGIYLWLSSDPRGSSWESLDILAHHNGILPSMHHIRPGKSGRDAEDPYQTTAYTEMVEVAPNRLLLVYDRIPFGWSPVPIDSDERSRIYALTIDIERI
ncbi:MAG: exo-alpha-sialidase [Chloroflexi bacterium]|nr:exo-alpha-sialidase [Chloroflexota bacterium]